jgi:Protein of unknown function (DUF3455)
MELCHRSDTPVKPSTPVVFRARFAISEVAGNEACTFIVETEVTIRFFMRALAASALLLATGPAAAMAQTLPAAIDVPPVPANLVVPQGQTLFFQGYAIGTQNYVCLPAGAGFAWKFVAPQATLFEVIGGQIGQQLTTHFLSANPTEDGLPRPTWQHSADTSRVWARLFDSSADPNYVEPGAIPWLLLKRAGFEDGPTAGSILSHTTYIHRLNTSGGRAPLTGCSAPVDIGALALVPYTADYFFYGPPGFHGVRGNR